MARRQTRRSVSLNGKVYRRVKQYATERDISLAKLTEQALIALMDGAPLSPPVRIVVPPRPVYPAATCACCVSAIAASTSKPLMIAWGRDGARVRVCEGCYPPDEDVAQPIANRRYRSADELQSKLRFQLLRAALRFDWAGPDDLAAALDIPSTDSDRRRRDNFNMTLSRLTRLGHFERDGDRGSSRYRITRRGRAEYDHQLQRSAA